jgi:hypothetical protein
MVTVQLISDKGKELTVEAPADYKTNKSGGLKINKTNLLVKESGHVAFIRIRLVDHKGKPFYTKDIIPDTPCNPYKGDTTEIKVKASFQP